MIERKNITKKRYKLLSKQKSLPALQTITTINKTIDQNLKPAEEWIYGKIKLSQKECLINIQCQNIYEEYQKSNMNSRKIFI